MQILIIQPKIGMGDMIIYLPYIHAISKHFKSPVTLLAKENSRANNLFADDGHISEIITLEKEMDGFKGIFKLVAELKKRNFDKIFIFSSSLRYKVVSKLLRVKSVFQYPLFKSKDNIVVSAKVFTEKITNNVVSTEPELKINKIKKKSDSSFKHICLGVSSSGPTKRWHIDNYIKLAEKINRKIKCKFYIAGGKKDIELINKLKNSISNKDCISFEKLSIKETLPLIKNCDLYIGNDTGWAHISVALKVKALTLFMDSPVFSYGRYSPRMITIEPEGEKNSTTHDTLGHDKISFDEVYLKAINLLI